MEEIIKINLSDKWSTLEGSVLGLQQRPILIQIEVNKKAKSHASSIIAAIDSVLKITPNDNLNSKKINLISKIPVWFFSIHKLSKIPLSSSFNISGDSRSPDNGLFWITLPSSHQEASKITLMWIASTINLFFNGVKFEEVIQKIELGLGKLKLALKPYSALGLNTHQILDSVYRLNIPVREVSPSIYMLGTGKYSRLISSTLTDHASFIGVIAAQDKQETARMLKRVGLPAGEHIIVDTPEKAIAAAYSLGFPVVVKPADQEQGRGVMADLWDEKIVRSAFVEAKKVSTKILIERHVKGFTHRLTVLNGEVIRVTKRIAGGIVGDGLHDISELIEILQQDAEYLRRSKSIGKELISLDEEARSLINQYGFKPSHILAKGEYLKLRRRDNVNAGATSQTIELVNVHPDNLQLAIDAAATLRLDFAGIDLIIENIEKSWRTIDALICEVNAKPQIVAPEDPLFYDGILKTIMREQYRIPLHLVIVPSNILVRHEMIKKWRNFSETNALSDSSGVWINGNLATRGFSNSYYAAIAMLSRINVDGGVCLMTPDDILKMGLPSNQWISIHIEQKALFNASEQLQLKSAQILLGTGIRINHQDD